MGSSLDWSREAFTLDEARNFAVRTAFKKMYDDGLIYRGNRVINWDPKGQTTISDDEVEHEERKATLYTFRYAKDIPIAIASTRPETKLGDTAIAVNPADKRYKKYVGKTFKTNFAGEDIELKVVIDRGIDQDFGTGALGVTPAHSIIDWEIAQKNGLPVKQVIDEHARMTVGMPGVKGEKTTIARDVVVEWLKKEGLLDKTEEIDQNISVSQRTGAVVEPLPKLQWFVDVNKTFKTDSKNLKGIKSGQEVTLKKLMQIAVRSGQVDILPGRFYKVYFHWIDSLRDWCISRQLWYGHRVPVWYCGGAHVAGEKRMGWHKDVVPQIADGKTKTYRLRNHDFKVGDRVLFENSQERKIFGYGIITEVEETTVEKIDYKDKSHYKTYKNLNELIAAFKLRNPDKDVTKKSKAYLYAYKFYPLTDKEKKNGCGQIIVSLEAPKKCPACGGAGLEQDSDTLDTWFSSALWTFSTLGWPTSVKTTAGRPQKTGDLMAYHPTDVLETAYDILFFWVARMILMSTYHLGEIPFHTVYLHGLVRDDQGIKISKSFGSNLDPVDMIHEYGADAVRMGLIMGTAPGGDSKISIDKIRGYRNFTTKVWNASRFVLMNYDEKLKARPSLTAKDKSNLARLNKMKIQVTANLEKYKFHQAGEELYQYFWHTFADKIIEDSKSRLSGDDSGDRRAAQETLMTILKECIKMLHPFTPFVTEEIWKMLPRTKGEQDLLIVEKW